jgi:hypothetical protein
VRSPSDLESLAWTMRRYGRSLRLLKCVGIILLRSALQASRRN